MNAKTTVTLIIGIAGLVITTWKGPSVWGAIAASATGIALLFGTLTIIPPSVRADIALIVSALQDIAGQGQLIPGQGLSAAHRLAARLKIKPANRLSNDDVKKEEDS